MVDALPVCVDCDVDVFGCGHAGHGKQTLGSSRVSYGGTGCTGACGCPMLVCVCGGDIAMQMSAGQQLSDAAYAGPSCRVVCARADWGRVATVCECV